MKKELSSDFLIESTLFLIFSAMMALMFHYTPLAFDDYAFISLYLDHNDGDPGFSLKAFQGYFNEMRTFDNSRISNQLAPVFGLMEPWRSLFGIISGLFCGFIALLTLRFSGLKMNRALGFAAVWLLMLIALPWRNCILVMDYSLNYIFATVITLLFLWLMLTVKDWRWSGSIGMALFAFVAGGFHEGFAFPTICGLGVYILLKRFRLSAGWWAVFLIYCASGAWFALSPGMLARLTRELTDPGLEVPLFKYLADLWLAIAVCLLLALRCVRRGFKSLWDDRRTLVLLTVMLVSGALSIMVEHTGRTAFWPEICAIVILIRTYGGKLENIRTGVANRCAIIIAALLTVQNLYALSWIKRIYDENEEIMTRLFPGEGMRHEREFGYGKDVNEGADLPPGTVFYDVVMPESVPPATLYMPVKSLWITGFQYQTLNGMYRPRKIAVVPESLREVTLGDSAAARRQYRLLSEKEGIYATEDALFMKDAPEIGTRKGAVFNVLKRNGERIGYNPGFLIRFASASGDSLLYLKPYKLSAAEIDSIAIAVSYPRGEEE